MVAMNEDKNDANPRLWLAIVVAATVMAYLLGYTVSARTGVEPGFFEKPETGGYGVSADKAAAPGLDKDLQNYYNELSE